MNKQAKIVSGCKWISFGLLIYFFCAAFSGGTAIIAVLIGLIGIIKLAKYVKNGPKLVAITLILLIYTLVLFSREWSIWLLVKPTWLELVIGYTLKGGFIYYLLKVLTELADSTNNQNQIAKRKGTIFLLFFLYCFTQPFILNISYQAGVYLFIGCILLSAVILSLIISLIVRVSSYFSNDKEIIPNE